MGNVVARERAAVAGDADALSRLRSRKPAEVTVPLATDDALLEAWQEAKSETFAGRTSRDPAARAAAEGRLAAARAELESRGLILWKLRNRGRKEYNRVTLECPPTDEERAKAKERGADQLWSSETFPAALVALCTAGDLEGITAGEITRMVDGGTLSEGELGHLFAKAIDLYVGTRVAELGK